jgi:hypothetical protein
MGELLVDRPNRLHVLLRHRLLRQPGGFEGAYPLISFTVFVSVLPTMVGSPPWGV